MARVSLSDMSSAGEESVPPIAPSTSKKSAPSRPRPKAVPDPADEPAPATPAEAPKPEPATPPKVASSATSLTIVGVTIPISLYEELTAALERVPNDLTPSYAQIVSWTCVDHPEAVADAAVRFAQGSGRVTPATEAGSPARRRPRGRPPRAGASTKLTLRFHGDELEPVTTLERRPVPKGVRMTRTAVATAAIRVALDTDLMTQLLDEGEV